MSHKATAQVVITPLGPQVRVDLVSGASDWPVLHSHGEVSWDRPETVPQYIRPKARKLLTLLRQRNRLMVQFQRNLTAEEADSLEDELREVEHSLGMRD